MEPASAPAPTARPELAERPDAWVDLKRYTSARIALGRTGGSLRSRELLDFRSCHAQARDAVHRPFDAARLATDLAAAGLPSLTLATQVADRKTYLRRPDLGRALSPGSASALRAWRSEQTTAPDICLILSDGLSALAAERHIVPTATVLHAHLLGLGWTICPLLVIPFARVKLQDEIGELLGARQTIMLLGERPGLGAPDSLGAYFTYRPRNACTDADRNCVSNIRVGGLPPVAAAEKLARLLLASVTARTSGVTLKDHDLPMLPSGPV